MTKLSGLSGSLRRGSFNTALLRGAMELMPDGAELTVHTVRGIPLYDADVELAEGIPRAVDELKEVIAASDGLLIATPEYNNSVPGVLKNAIDWLSRPAGDISRVFGGRPVAIMGAIRRARIRRFHAARSVTHGPVGVRLRRRDETAPDTNELSGELQVRIAHELFPLFRADLAASPD